MGKPAARLGDPVQHPLPPVLTGGPTAITVWIGNQPAWRAIPAASVAALKVAKQISDKVIDVAENAAKAAQGTPGAPAARVAAELAKTAALAAMGAGISAAAAGSDIHACATPWPVPPHGPAVDIEGSQTVIIANFPAAVEGDELLEAIGGTNKITMGCQTVLIGDSSGGGGGGGGGFGIGGGEEGGEGGGGLGAAAAGLLGQLADYLKELYYEQFGERYSDGIVIKGPKEYREKVKQRLDELKQTETGRKTLEELDRQGREGKGVVIVPAEPGDNSTTRTGNPDDAFPKDAAVNPDTGRVDVTTPGDGTTSEVGFNPDYEPTYPDGSSCRSPAVGLGHELIHASHNGNGTNLRNFEDPSDPGGTSNHEEAQTIGRGAYEGDSPTDNSLRDEMGYKRRDSHSSVCP